MHKDEKMDPDIEIDLSDDDVEDEDIFEISPEDPLYSQIDEECKKSKDLLDRLQRLQAEFDNYRKRMDARFSDVAKFASEDILLKVIDVYDNLLRAIEMDFVKDPKAAKDGISAIQQQFEKMLSSEGVRPIESVGLEFDPYYQHAVQRMYDPEKPDGVILEEFQRGYMLKEKVLRPAVVCVNRHEDTTVESNNEEDKKDDSDKDGEK
ncbi:MAG: nucleotide exchange factor GrpE [Candidatus Thorarchaeota archaeon]